MQLSDWQTATVIDLGLRHACGKKRVNHSDVAAVLTLLGCERHIDAVMEAVVQHVARSGAVVDIRQAQFRKNMKQLCEAMTAMVLEQGQAAQQA